MVKKRVGKVGLDEKWMMMMLVFGGLGSIQKRRRCYRVVSCPMMD
jgi:hypothetical protein